jgi:hypothetical protein
MPLTINVGLNRKASKDYQSTGASINLTAELDQSLLARPDELQGAVSELYEQAEQALDRQVNGSSREVPPRRSPQRQNGSNGHGRGNGHAQNSRGMTQSQRKAIHAIADQLGVDAAEEARHEFGIDLDRASIAEASKLIDHLKTLQGAAGNGSRR